LRLAHFRATLTFVAAPYFGFVFFFMMIVRRLRSTLFPYTTLFRSEGIALRRGARRIARRAELDGGVEQVPLVAQRLQRRHGVARSEEHTSELQSRGHLVCRLLLEKKKRHLFALKNGFGGFEGHHIG